MRKPPSTVVALAVAVVAYGSAVLLASVRPGPATWGFDLPGYLSNPSRWVVILFGAVGAALLALGMATPAKAPTKSPGGRAPLLERIPALAWLFLVYLSVGLWLLRARSHLLGDQQLWMDCFRAHQYRLFSEPLAAGLWYAWVAVLEAAKWNVAPGNLAVLPAVFGALAAFFMWKISGLLVPPGKPRTFPFLLLLTLGMVQLYCGYIESYPIASVAVLAFAWLGLRQLATNGSILPAALAFLAAFLSHLFTLYLLPGYFYLAFRSTKGLARRLGLAIGPLVVGMLLLPLIHRGTDFLNPFRILWVALGIVLREGPAPGSSVASLLGPASDLINLYLLVMPIPLLLLIAGAREMADCPWSPGRTLLAITAGSGLLVAMVLVLPGSPSQDWDLMSLAVLPVAIFAVSRGEGRHPLHDSRPIRYGLLALGVASSLAFVLVNTDAGAATRRFKTLMHPTARLSTHERAYGNEKLMLMYESEGKRDSAVVYARRALEAGPTNARYWTNLGIALYRLGRYDEAIPTLEEAVRHDPKSWPARYDLGLSYLAQERYATAADHLALAARMGPDRPDALQSLGVALYRSGKVDSAVVVWKEILVRWPEYAKKLQELKVSQGVAAPEEGAIDLTPTR
jgi:tetratricopeptide (TPR) repeat protein